MTAFTRTAVKAETGTKLCVLKIDILPCGSVQVAWPHQASVSSFIIEDVHMGMKVRMGFNAQVLGAEPGTGNLN